MSFIGRPCSSMVSALWHAVEEKSYDHPGVVQAAAPLILITKSALEAIEAVAVILSEIGSSGTSVFSEISFKPLALPISL